MPINAGDQTTTTQHYTRNNDTKSGQYPSLWIILHQHETWLEQRVTKIFSTEFALIQRTPLQGRGWVRGVMDPPVQRCPCVTSNLGSWSWSAECDIPLYTCRSSCLACRRRCAGILRCSVDTRSLWRLYTPSAAFCYHSVLPRTLT